MARIVKKFQERKAEIIQVARHLFQTQDYDKTTMQDLVEALGIAKGTLYHYFKSKEKLLEAVVEDIAQESIDQMHAFSEKSSHNALQKIELLIKGGSLAASHKSLLDYLHKPGNEEMHIRLLTAILIKQAPLYAKVIEQGCAEGIFKAARPLECAEFILSAVQFLTDRGIYPWTQEDLSRRIQAFPTLIEQLLAAPTGSFQFLARHISDSLR